MQQSLAATKKKKSKVNKCSLFCFIFKFICFAVDWNLNFYAKIAFSIVKIKKLIAGNKKKQKRINTLKLPFLIYNF